MSTITPYYRSTNKDFTLVEGDCMSVLETFDFKFDMIFADPPYFLSNGGISVSSGKVVCVDKGTWDKAPTPSPPSIPTRAADSTASTSMPDILSLWHKVASSQSSAT